LRELGDNRASFCVSPHFFKNLVRFELETPHDSRAINQNEGATLAAILIMHGRISWLLLPAIVGGFLLWLVHYTSRRVDKHETDRLSWRKGALGEYEVGAELERLSDAFFIFNDVNTRHGNFDHVVVGPTGLFAIETKNWNGLIGADASDELRKNGRDASSPHVRKFLRRSMVLRDQIVALTHSNGLYVRCVMVFPKAHIEAKFGDTGKVHCIGVDQLRDYIDNAKFSQKFTSSRIDELVER
jgi:hypothetical protein